MLLVIDGYSFTVLIKNKDILDVLKKNSVKNDKVYLLSSVS